ncbi:hypothetical protein NFHSH190041_19120 [Shewanella sp. NFH-SH190041]|nr:hypothetical protein NFHSH190041_19120 [Shewanella sp. NFH-SH190041]
MYNINRASNGISLPTDVDESLRLQIPVHHDGHLASYYDNVATRLAELDSIQNELTNSELLEQVSLIEDGIRSDLLNSKIRLHIKGY